MDKKNTFLGILFLVLAAGAFFMGQPSAKELEAQRAAQAQQQAAQAAAAPKPVATAPQAAPTASITATVPADSLFVAPKATEVGTHTLENDYIQVVFTTKGGAIERVVLKKFPAFVGTTEPAVEFNSGAPVSALALGKGALLDAMGPNANVPYIQANFKLEEATATSVRYALELPSGLRIVRTYDIASVGDEAEPYLIQHKTTLENRGQAALPADVLWLNIGELPPTLSDNIGDMLSFGYYNADGDTFESVKVFSDSSGFLGIGARAAKPYVVEGSNIEWGAVRNQFFAAIITPKGKLKGLRLFAKSEMVDVPATEPSTQETSVVGEATAQKSAQQKGIAASLSFAGEEIAPGEAQTLDVSYYVGPKEYVRLDRLGGHQDLVMSFGWVSFISKAMLLLLIGVHSLIVHVSPAWGWGWSIIIVTIIIKLLIWPLTGIQTRSAKRMAKIQEPLKAVREQFKDNPQRMQQETIKLFKQHKVNPAAGCLPLFIQLPIFIGLFYMLKSAPELRYAPFLWFKDLSMPDTVGHIGGFAIHLMPLLMGATMMLQMKLAPTPTTDPMQRRMFQFMPLIFLVFCYTFPSGLVLYWTVQNIFTIFQQWLTNRKKDDEPTVTVLPAAKGTGAQRMAPVKVKRKNR